MRPLDDVQQSLRSKGLEEVSRIGLSKYFAYVGLEHIADYCYVDNKGTYTVNPIQMYL